MLKRIWLLSVTPAAGGRRAADAGRGRPAFGGQATAAGAAASWAAPPLPLLTGQFDFQVQLSTVAVIQGAQGEAGPRLHGRPGLLHLGTAPWLLQTASLSAHVDGGASKAIEPTQATRAASRRAAGGPITSKDSPDGAQVPRFCCSGLNGGRKPHSLHGRQGRPTRPPALRLPSLSNASASPTHPHRPGGRRTSTEGASRWQTFRQRAQGWYSYRWGRSGPVGLRSGQPCPRRAVDRQKTVSPSPL